MNFTNIPASEGIASFDFIRFLLFQSGRMVHVPAGAALPLAQTFTPTIVGTSTAGTGTYSTQVGQYAKSGNIVFFAVSLTWSAHTGTGNLKVAGLPVSATMLDQPVTMTATNLATSGPYTAQILSATEISLLASGSSIPMDTAATVRLSGFYFA